MIIWDLGDKGQERKQKKGTKSPKPVGRPRTRQVKVCEWAVTTGKQRRVFTNYANALRFASTIQDQRPRIEDHRWYVRDWEITRTPKGRKWTKFEVRSTDLNEAIRLADKRIEATIREEGWYITKDLAPGYTDNHLEIVAKRAYEARLKLPEDDVRAVVERYQDRQRAMGKMAGSTYTTHRGILDTWIDRDFTHDGKTVNLGKTRLSRVSQPIFESWLVMLVTTANRYGRPNSAETFKLAVSVLRVAWAELEFNPETRNLVRALNFSPRRLATFVPAGRGADEQKEIKQRARDAFDPASIRKLIEKSQERDPVTRAILALALLGIRSPSEIAGAMWEDIEEEFGVTWFQPVRSVVTVGKGKSRKVSVSGMTKTGVPDVRTIPLSKWQRDALEALPNRTGFIVGAVKEPAHPDMIRARFDKLMELAKVEDATQALSINSCRHTVITHIKRLVDGDRRARLIGHANKGRDMVAKHYDRNTRSDHRRLLMVDETTSVMDVMPWWSKGI